MTPDDVLRGRRDGILIRRKEVKLRLYNGVNNTTGSAGSPTTLPHPLDLSLTKVGHFCWLPTVTDEPGLVKPDEQLTVYRGCTLETRWRLSWTTDLGQAEWFAARLKLFGYAGTTVYSADVPPRHVLGLIQGRNVHEVVVNPYGLRNWTALGMSALPAGEVDGS